MISARLIEILPGPLVRIEKVAFCHGRVRSSKPQDEASAVLAPVFPTGKPKHTEADGSSTATGLAGSASGI